MYLSDQLMGVSMGISQNHECVRISICNNDRVVLERLAVDK